MVEKVQEEESKDVPHDNYAAENEQVQPLKASSKRLKSKIQLTDFGTTKKQPWWEKAPDDLAPFRRDFYTNVEKYQDGNDVVGSEDSSSSDEA